jgi:3-oxoacyl-[acyl-carrier protein] reductase
MNENNRPTAVVTGASRGIGHAIALALADAGHDIAGVSRTLNTTAEKAGLDSLKPKIEAAGARFLPLAADISDIGRHEELVSAVLETFGRLDFLVNNAGVAPLKRVDILETTTESFDRLLSINLRGPFFFTQVVARAMLKSLERDPGSRPRVVFITSLSAEVSSTNRAEYCVSKAGLSMAARVFADRLAGVGIGVFEIRPGIILTDMTAPVRERYDKLIAEGLIPQGRWGEPADVAKAVTAIARGDLDYATGCVIEISGGMDIRRL